MGHSELATRRAALVGDLGLRGQAFARAYADAVVAWVRTVPLPESGVVVLATGALGRRELSPGSDLDLTLVSERRKDVGTIAERLWYPIWDAGIPLDHSVRTVREVIRTADAELEVALGLLDGRFVAGDATLATRVLTTVRDRWASNARHRLPSLDELTRGRHEGAGDVAHLLEPDLKQGKGGLRDLRVLHAVDLATSVWEADEAELLAAGAVLLDVRIALHRVVARATDRLGLEHQDAVAKLLGEDADALMRAVARAGRTIARASDDAWRRVRSSLAGPRGRRGGADRALGDGIVLRDGEIDLRSDAPLDDPTLLVRLAEAAARSDAQFRRGVLERMRAAAAPVTPWPDGARRALVGLLASGEPLVAVVDALDQHGLMTRILPEWEAVRSLPQRNALHRYTVDRHLVETAVQASRLTRDVTRPDLLAVGAWLHDIGKGFPGDHTEVGIDLMGAIARRFGFAAPDVEVLVAMVRHHLLLASVATSRDLDDPVTIEQVAAAVGDVTTLELLVALTEADSLATGQGVWTDWKRQLVRTLARRVAIELEGEGGRPVPVEAGGSQPFDGVAVEGSVGVDVADRFVRIHAPDRPGLLAALVGLLAIHGQNVRSVSATADDRGIAIDVFEVEAAFDGAPDWSRFRADLDAVLHGELPVDERLLERTTRYRRAPSAAHPNPPRVILHPDASDRATVLEVRANDDVGLLARITGVLSGLGLDIVQARAVTLGHEAIDTFYVRDAEHGGPVDDRVAELEQVVLAALG